MHRSTVEYLKLRNEMDKVLIKTCKCFEQKLDEKKDLAAIREDAEALTAIIRARASITYNE